MPINWRRTFAGLQIGPSRLNTVRNPRSRRTGATFFIAGWYDGAKRNAKPGDLRLRAAAAASRSIGTPSVSRTSAAPVRDDIARLPCLATGTPHAATTNAVAVETLSVPALSPPVPHTSMALGGALTVVIALRIARAAPAISGT